MTTSSSRGGAAGVKKGDVFSRTYYRTIGGYHHAKELTTDFLIVMSVRKGVIYGRRCFHKRDAQQFLQHCDRIDYDAEGFEERMQARGWKPDTLDDDPVPTPRPAPEEA
jgi:hypothetical protein